jgi:molecular chaperone DnaJ
MRKNYYEILEVSQNASPEVIDKAYKALTMKYHPDMQPKGATNSSSTDKFKEIVKAYKVLSDPDQKAEYDQEQRINVKASSNNNTNSNQDTNQKVPKSRVISYATTYAQSIHDMIQNHSKKSKDERSKDIKALVIALVFMVVLIILFWKVPFLRNILFP